MSKQPDITIVKSGKAIAPKLQASENQSIRPQQQRRRLLYLSFVLCVALPFLLISSYYAFLATDRYASTAGFSIRGIETSSGLDGIGALTGLVSAGSTTADSYIVLDFIKSRSLVELLDKTTNLRAIYSDQSIDWWSRLGEATVIEDFAKYWQTRISTEFDPSSGIIEFTVQSFSPDHALFLAQEIIANTHDLVNGLSATAREDTLKFAEQEVILQEQRLRSALEAIKSFREMEQSVDPNATASLDIQLLADLEAQLIDIKARIAVQSETLNDGAPSLVALRRQADALSQQIEARRAEISGETNGARSDSVNSVTAQLTAFETLDVERKFAEQSYASALNSLEQARRDADRQQRYLAVHSQPQLAELSQYPRRLRNILLSAFLLFSAWAIGTLITYSVRDHLT